MSDISSLIEVFKMDELNRKTRASIIIKLGIAINYQLGNNITEPIVYELVDLLDPQNKILTDAHYMRLNNV